MKLGLHRTKRDRKLCRECREHKAVSIRPADGRVQFQRWHDLCPRCFRDAIQRATQSNR